MIGVWARTLGRRVGAAGRFLWSFLVDDTPEIPVIVAALVVVAFALRHHNAAAVVAVPLGAVSGLGFCVWRACRDRAGP